EDGTDVGVVVHGLHDDHPAGPPQQVGRGGQGLALHRGEGAAVHVVAGDAFGQLGGDGVDGGGEFVDDVAHDVDPLGREQHGPHLVPGVLGPADDLLALGDEESLGGVAPAAHVGGGPARGAGAAGGGGGRDAGGRRP